MFKHEKQLLKDVRVDGPNPNYANMMQEQIGGPHGELKAGLQYLTQVFRIKDPAIHDLFLDSKEYFDLSTPGKFYDRNNLTNPKPPKFSIPNQPNQQG